jgi:peptidase E
MQNDDKISPKGKIMPIYLLSGGHGAGREHNRQILRRIFDSTGIQTPSIAYIGAANDDDNDFFVWTRKTFTDAGAGVVTLAPLSSRVSDTGDAMHILTKADLIFISGGDVDIGMNNLEEKKMMSSLKQFHRNGKTFFGSSAGSIMLARKWIRWIDPSSDETAELYPCLRLARVFCDTHAETDEWEELRALLDLVPENTIGYGIPTNSALAVYPDGGVQSLAGPIHRLKSTKEEITRIADLLPSGS